jgi:hypothetical protein
MSIHVRRAPLYAVIVLAASLFGYIVLANAFLWLRGVRWLYAGTQSVRIEYSSAWTLWPGVVHARDLFVSVQDHNVQTSLRFEQAEVSIRLNELPRRVFHARKVRGDGFQFRFRHRVMPESKELPAVAALPPIQGFEDPPVFEAWAPEAPLSEDEYDLWTIELDDVDVAAGDVWIQQFRYIGRARARGAFRLRPARALWVGPASLALEPGVLVAGGKDVATSFSGQIDCEVLPFDVRTPKGLEVMRFISAKARFHGDVATGAAVELFLPVGTGVEPYEAVLDADVKLDEGILSPASRIRVGGSRLVVRAGSVATELGKPWELVATGDDSGPGGRVRALVSTGSLAAGGCGAVAVGVSEMSFDVASSSRDTVVPWGIQRAEASVRAVAADGQWDDLHVSGRAGGELTVVPATTEGTTREVALKAFVEAVRLRSDAGPPKRWSAEVPSARITARLQGERLTGPVSVIATGAKASIGDTETKFDFSADVRSEESDIGTRRSTIAGNLDVRNASLSKGKRRVDDWWANVRFERMNLYLERSLEFSGRLSARLRDGLPGLFVLAEKDEIPSWLPTVLPLNRLTGVLDVQRHCQTMFVDFPRLEGGPLVGRGRIHNAPGRTEGAILVRFGGAGMLSAGIDLGGSGGHVAPLAGDAWLSERLARMDADRTRASTHSCPASSRCGQ